MVQSKRDSFIEAIVNTLIGFTITCLVSPFIYWISGVEIKMGQIGIVTFWFTMVSVLRNYFIRRWFNGKIYKRF